MGFVLGLKCKECGREFPAEALHVCDFCFGPLGVVYDYDRIKRTVRREDIERGPRSMWRYAALLPLDGDPKTGHATGYTPLLSAPRLGEAIGHRNLYIKNDAVNVPTLSFKDRVVAVAASKALELGFDTLSCASTGNLAGAVAAHAAAAGMSAVIFVPETLEPTKIRATLVYAPHLVAVQGDYDQVNRLCSELSGKYPWAFVNINIRAYYAEGSKTLGYEIIEALGWRTPRHIVIPVASGSLLAKTALGIREMMDFGWVAGDFPSIHAAQPEGCAPVAHAVRAGTTNIAPVHANTIAKSLAIGNPADGYYAAKTCLDSGGSASAVTDDEVVEGIRLLASTEGILGETAAGVTVATARNLIREGRIAPDETTVLTVTGNGLKTLEALEATEDEPIRVAAKFDDADRVLSRLSVGRRASSALAGTR